MIKYIFFDLYKVITQGDFSNIYENFASRVGISTETVSDFHK